MNKNKFITSVKSKKNKNTSLFSFIIIADNVGYRMKSHGPTPLISFNNKKLIDIQVESICKNFDQFEIIICCGEGVEKIHKYIQNNYKDLNIRIVENQLTANSNSCETLRLGLNNTSNDKIFILDGHLLINNNIFSDRIEKSFAYIEKNKSENIEIGVNVNKDNNIEHFSYGAAYQWSEIIFLHNKEIVESMRKTVSNIEFKQKFIFEALNELIKRNYQIKSVVNIHSVEKINNIKTYHKTRESK